MPKAVPFSDEEKRFVLLNYDRLSIREIASEMNRTASGVKRFALDLGLRRGSRFEWTTERTELLKKRYSDTKSEVLAEEMGCALHVVYGKANRLNLKKSEEFLNSPDSGRLTIESSAELNSRCKSGNPPRSIRKRIGSFGRSSETQFKKGSAPHNKQPVGTILRVKLSPYLRIKIADPDRWEFLHRYNWEQTHGAMPDGFVVWFKDQNRENCAVENLECLSRQELRQRITINYDRRKPGEPARNSNRRRRRRKPAEPLNEFYPYKVQANENGLDLINRINRIVPKGLTDSLRADVCQELALRVCTGEIEESRLAEILPEVIKMQKKFLLSFYTVALDGIEDWQRDRLESRFIQN